MCLPAFALRFVPPLTLSLRGGAFIGSSCDGQLERNLVYVLRRLGPGLIWQGYFFIGVYVGPPFGYTKLVRSPFGWPESASGDARAAD